MKIVLNRKFGAFKCPFGNDVQRDDERLIEYAESADNRETSETKLVVIEFSQRYFQISNYDGYELAYVSNSPICKI